MIDLLSGLAILAAMLLVFLAGLAIMARLNRLEADDEDGGPKTILIGPAQDDEPLGDMVDVGGIVKRYAED